MDRGKYKLDKYNIRKGNIEGIDRCRTSNNNKCITKNQRQRKYS